MSNRERTVLGDKLIRDRLAEMTKEFVKSYTAGTDTNSLVSDDINKKIKQETAILQSMHDSAYLNNKKPSLLMNGAKCGSQDRNRWIDERDKIKLDYLSSTWDIFSSSKQRTT